MLHETFINRKIKRDQTRESLEIVGIVWELAPTAIFFSRMRKFSILRRPVINKMTVCTRGHPSKLERKRRHHLARLMDWLGINWRYGFINVLFCEQGVKTSTLIYQQMLREVVKPLNMKMFKEKSWIFQQDSVPAHKARTTQAWLQRSLPRFIAAEDWTSDSSNVNPSDYSLLAQLESIVCVKPHKSVDGLEKAITKAVKKFSIDDWPERLRKCTAIQGGHFK